jgi:Tol biopolymer transport system component
VQLFQLKVETLEASRLTKPLNGRGDRGPVYSPDGTQVAFYSDRNGNQDLYLLSLASGYVQQLAASPQSDTEPSFAPDGSALVFVSTRSGSTALGHEPAQRDRQEPGDPADLTSSTRLTRAGGERPRPRRSTRPPP